MQAFNRIIPITLARFSLDVLNAGFSYYIWRRSKISSYTMAVDPSAQSRELLNAVYFLSGVLTCHAMHVAQVIRFGRKWPQPLSEPLSCFVDFKHFNPAILSKAPHSEGQR